MTKVMRIAAATLTISAATCLGIGSASAQESQGDEMAGCAGLPSHAQLHAALTAARDQANGGFNLDMWGTVVNRDGVVCAVAFTGTNRGSQWPGSRVISAQKANTANAFSLPQLALSTANLYSAVQPGGSLFGLQASNPVNTHVAYRGVFLRRRANLRHRRAALQLDLACNGCARDRAANSDSDARRHVYV